MKHPLILAIFFSLVASSLFSQGILPSSRATGIDPLAQRAFSLPELKLRGMPIPIEYILNRLPNREAWSKFFSFYGKCLVYIDGKSGTPVNIMHQFPLIPGTGDNNKVTLDQISAVLGYPVTSVTNNVVVDLFDHFVRDNSEVLAIDVNQLGEHKVFQTNNDLWQVNISQQLNGIPVRDSRLGGTVSHGNLAVFGLTRWKNVSISTSPKISAQQAYNIGFDYAGGRSSNDEIWKEAALEIVTVDTGGENYSHRLLWIFGFRRVPFIASWEVLVDAHTGQMVAFRDVNQYL